MEEEGSLFSTASSGFNLCSCCCCSVTQSCPALCDSMDCSTWGFLVFHCFPEFVQTHVHWVSDAIQPFHPLSPPSPLARNLFQHQGLIQWVNSHQVAKVLEFQLESFQWIFSALGLRMIWSPYSSRDSQESSPTSQFESINFQPSAFSLHYGPTLTSVHDYWKNHSFDLYGPLSAKWCLCFLTCCLGLS